MLNLTSPEATASSIQRLFGRVALWRMLRRQGCLNRRRYSRRRVHPRAGLPASEALEQRVLLAAIAWDGEGGNSNWHDALNWTGDVLPTAGDDVTIDAAVNVVVSESASVRSLQVTHSLILTGSLDIAEASTIRHLTISAGGLTGAGDLTVEGVFDWSGGFLAGTGQTIVAAGAELNLVGDGQKDLYRTLENAGTALYSGSGLLLRTSGVIDNLAGASFTVEGEADFGQFNSSSHAFHNAGTFIKRGEGTTTGFVAVPFHNSGTIDVQQGNLQLDGGGGVFRLDGMKWLSLNNGTSINVPAGLVGETTNVDLFSILGTVTLQGGSVAEPSPLEVMGQDLGAVAAGFRRNFAYDRLQLQSAHVRLEDTADNASGATAEALYINTLIVPAGSTLDLNGIALYARTAQIAGTVINGNVTVVPEGGMLLLSVPVSGSIGVPQEIDEWTFYGRSGRAVAILADPMTTLEQVQVQVLDPSGAILASAASEATGGSVLLLGVELPSDGVYRVQISAAEPVTSNTGDYRLTVFDATVDVNPLVFHQRHIGALESNFSVDRWTFSSAAGQALRLDWINADSPSLRFRLTGPDGWVGFDGINSDSEVVVTPAAGEYVLEAYSNGHAAGHYAFQMLNLSAIELTSGELYAGTLVGTGDAQLFKVAITDPSPLSVFFEGVAGDNVEVYARLHAPPTRQLFDARNEDVGPEHLTLVPLAAPGTWYVLLYGERFLHPEHSRCKQTSRPFC
jgi:hypothetical protein